MMMINWWRHTLGRSNEVYKSNNIDGFSIRYFLLGHPVQCMSNDGPRGTGMICVSRAEQVVAWVGNFAAPLTTQCSESMDFKRLVNFSELAQPHYITCSFGMKYLCKYRCCLTCFSPSFRTERYWRFRCSFSISVSVLVHSGSGQIVRCTVRNVCWKFGADTVTQREVIRGGNLKTYVYPL